LASAIAGYEKYSKETGRYKKFFKKGHMVCQASLTKTF